MEVNVQYTIKNLQGRSVRLDVLAADSAGKQYNIEIQRDDRGAGARRARHNSSLMDANSLLATHICNIPDAMAGLLSPEAPLRQSEEE